MKYKTTIKAVKQELHPVACGYCAMAYLLHYIEPVAYNSGVYGWNFDVYEVKGVTISTGYRYMPGKWISWSLLEHYETQAREIVESRKPLEDKKQAIDILLDNLCYELKYGEIK